MSGFGWTQPLLGLVASRGASELQTAKLQSARGRTTSQQASTGSCRINAKGERLGEAEPSLRKSVASRAAACPVSKQRMNDPR